MDGTVALITAFGAIALITLLALIGESIVRKLSPVVKVTLIFIFLISAMVTVGAIHHAVSITPVVFLW